MTPDKQRVAEPAQAPGGVALDAREDWEQRIYRRITETAGSDASLALPAPTGLTATGGVGHIRLTWDEVDGAAGYVIERSDADGVGGVILDHGGSDVPAVAGTEYADTGLPERVTYSYRVGAVAGGEYPVWAWSGPVQAQLAAGPAGDVLISVDAAQVVGTLDRVWRMVGSERLSQLGLGVDEHGHDVGSEFAESLRLAKDELGVSQVRAHAILHDDNAVAHRAADGTLRFDFERVDAVYDQVLGMGIRPVVELSFMPAALAKDPEQTVFTYRGIISPPRKWSEWRELVRALAAHLVERYGIDEVAGWGFEVWNEPNLEVFWTGTQEDYFRLYDEAAEAVKSVDERLLVGGPSTAATEWVEALAAHAAQTGTALDFVSSHTYGNIPIDVRPSLQRNGFGEIPIWWTEWGVGYTHFGPIHDGPIGAPFVLSGLWGVQGRMDALAYWVISDHFEELGRPPRLFHNGFGLLSVGNLRKPRYWGVYLAAQLGNDVLASSVRGDGAAVLVKAWSARTEDGVVDVLVWNSTLNTDLAAGDERLDRTAQVVVRGLRPGRYAVELARVDAHHSNVVAACPVDVEWPDPELSAKLHELDHLDVERLADLQTTDGTGHFVLELPMPGVARIRLNPAGGALGPDERNAS